MSRALRHRGPDDAGVLSLPQATLVHTRLSIIDLSDSGRQPMTNEDGTVCVVFNGEIYNHKDLRASLESRGHVFRGHSDSEVLPHLYEEYGVQFVEKIRGMFALAVYDARSRTLLLARDRFGIKPLFYASTSARLVFASELNALLDVPGLDLRPDRQAVYDFAALLYIPAPQTFFSGIRSLQPGELLEARLQPHRLSTRTHLYHRWRIRIDHLSPAEAAHHTESLINQAVSRQLESDVPLGSLLSGGIDSSLVSCAAQSRLGGSLRTFNVRFSEVPFDETWAAVAVAKHIRSQHETFDIVSTPGTWDSVTGLLLHAGQPFADTSLFAAHAVCKLMREHVAVALSGDGGDEAYGGYNTYWQIERILHYQKLPPAARHSISAALGALSLLGVPCERLAHRVADFNDGDHASVMQALFCWLREDEHRALCRDESALPVRRWFAQEWEYESGPRESALERLSAQTTEIYTRLVMANDFLFKVDTASMKESLEVRVPMLDEDLFAFGLSLPHASKVSGRTCKRVLRSVAGRWLPHDVAHKPKWGFAIPLDTWVKTEFKEGLRETLLSSSSRLEEFFNPEAYRPVVEAFCSGQGIAGISRQGLYQRAIMLLSMHLHLERARTGSMSVPATAPVCSR